MSSALKRNSVMVTGAGKRAIVFGHGFGSDQTGWRRVIPRFEDSFSVIRYDLTGLGHSDKTAYEPQRYASFEQHAADLLEIIAELGHERVCYTGHSASGMIGLLAATKEPARFEKIAVVGASPRYMNDGSYVGGLEPAQVDAVTRAIGDDYHAWHTTMLPMAANLPARSSVVTELNETFSAVEANIAAHFLRVIFHADYRHVLSEVETETLVLQPTIDPFVPPEVGQYIASHVQRGRLQMLQARGGHYPHMGEPQVVAAALASFFQR